MIADKSRADWFGASDTTTIMGKWTSKTFEKWWLQKLGINNANFNNVYTLAGTHFEHPILESLNLPMELDKQIILPELRLRINLDGNTVNTIYECKTYKDGNKFYPSKYEKQVQVQMFGSGLRKAYIVAYPLTENEYKNFLLDIDTTKIELYSIEYDEKFITKYLVRLRYLADCLDKGKFPQIKEII